MFEQVVPQGDPADVGGELLNRGVDFYFASYSVGIEAGRPINAFRRQGPSRGLVLLPWARRWVSAARALTCHTGVETEWSRGNAPAQDVCSRGHVFF